jgi:sporulation protein YlmC with PRC-barrel domain
MTEPNIDDEIAAAVNSPMRALAKHGRASQMTGPEHEPFSREALKSGGKVIGNDGDEVGSVGQIYVDDQTGNPSWVTVNTGLVGSNETFVPLEGASPEGNDVRVRYSKDRIKDAPNVAPTTT